MRLVVLLVSCLLCWQAVGKDIQEEAAYWKGTDLGLAYILKFISNTKCYSSPEYLLSCVKAINSAGTLLNPTRQIVVRDYLQLARHGGDAEGEFSWQEMYLEKRHEEQRLAQAVRTYFYDREGGDAPYMNFEHMMLKLLAQLPDEVPRQMFWGYLLSGHLQSFDSHAYVVPTNLLEYRQKRSQKEFVGIGINLDFLSSGVLVHEVFAGSPAARAGLHEDDRVLAIAPDGENMIPIEGKDPEALYDLLPGPEGTPVSLKVARGDAQLIMKMRRGSVSIPTLSAELIGPKKDVGYIQLRSFESLEICRALKERMQKLASGGAKAWLLDLRGNSGGEKLMALCVAGLFIGPKTVMGTKPLEFEIPSLNGLFTPAAESALTISWEPATSQKITDLPLVVLINALSASASELVAGALQDHGRAWLVGERTAGKATVQMWRSPPDNPTITIARTISRFYQPSGRSNQIVGVTPNFDVPLRRYASERDRFYPREEDLYPNTPAAVSGKWSDPRSEETRVIQICVDLGDLDTAALKEFTLSSSRPDYQKAYSLAVLKCL